MSEAWGGLRPSLFLFVNPYPNGPNAQGILRLAVCPWSVMETAGPGLDFYHADDGFRIASGLWLRR